MASRPIVEPDQSPSDTRLPTCRIWLKVVPGSRRTEVSGPLGDRLKVRVSAPPEDGRANRAVCETLASALGLHDRDVTIIAGHASPEKTARAVGIDHASAAAKLGLSQPS
ncbi:MAG: DUF167 domain-containing protein [Phycisphaerales bacterium]|nr:DUF167 domain-containing protein [Phycisphaerales bacterium]